MLGNVILDVENETLDMKHISLHLYHDFGCGGKVIESRAEQSRAEQSRAE